MGEPVATFLEWAKTQDPAYAAAVAAGLLFLFAFVQDFLRPILRTLAGVACAALKRRLARR